MSLAFSPCPSLIAVSILESIPAKRGQSISEPTREENAYLPFSGAWTTPLLLLASPSIFLKGLHKPRPSFLRSTQLPMTSNSFSLLQYWRQKIMLSNLNIRHTQKLLRHRFKITPGGHCHNKVTLLKY